MELSITDPLEPGVQSWVYFFAHDGTLDPSAGQHLVDYDFSLDLRRLQGHLPPGQRPQPRGLDRHDCGLRPPLLRPLGRRRAPHHGRRRHRGRHPRSAPQPVRPLRVRAQRGHVLRRRGRLRRQPGGPDPGHPLVRRRQQRPAQPADPPLLRGPPRDRQRPPGPRHPRDDGPPRLQPGGGGHDVPQLGMGADVTIDGVPDNVSAADSSWQLVRGAQGSLISVRRMTFDQPLPAAAFSSYYLDDTTPPGDMCTGDSAAYGVSGLRVTASIANTDPRYNPYYRYRGRRVLTYRAPGATAADARLRPQTGRGSAARHRPKVLRLPAPPLRRRRRSGLDLARPRLGGPPRAGHRLRGRGLPPRRRGPPGCGGQHALARRRRACGHHAPRLPRRPAGAFYEDALAWAVEAGVVTGYPDGRFGPRDPVTRGQVVNLLWATAAGPRAPRPTGSPTYRRGPSTATPSTGPGTWGW